MGKVIGGALVMLFGIGIAPGFALLWVIIGVVLIAMGLQERGAALRAGALIRGPGEGVRSDDSSPAMRAINIGFAVVVLAGIAFVVVNH